MGRVKAAGVKGTSLLGIFVLIVLALGLGIYLVLGNPVYTVEDIDTSNVVGYTAAGLNANLSNVHTDNGYLEFTPGAACAKLVIPMKDQVKDMKGSVNALEVDLSKVEYSSVWELAKVKLSDGTTEIALGSISESGSKIETFSIDSDDWDNLDDFAKPKVIILFYDENGNLLDALSTEEQRVGIAFLVKLDTSTITGFASSVLIALVAAIRKVVSAITSTVTAFLIAITTNSAVLTVVSAVAVLMLFFMASKEAKRIKRYF